MQLEQNITLNIFDCLRCAYQNIVTYFKEILIGSYLLGIVIYLASFVMPKVPTESHPDNYIIFIVYVSVGLMVHVFLSLIIYRLLSLGKDQFLKITSTKVLSILSKMFLYSIGLMCLLFLAMLALLLFVGLITAIINETSGQTLLSNNILEPIVNITMLAVSLLIMMRLQPTFISLATDASLIPMKSSFYYTRDNTKKFIAIGLLGFIPSLMPSLIIFGLINILDLTFLSGDIIALLVFPFLLLPNLVILSTGLEVYKTLVADQENNEVDISI